MRGGEQRELRGMRIRGWADQNECCRWIARKVVEILAVEDDVVIDFIFSMLEEERFVSSLAPWILVETGGC